MTGDFPEWPDGRKFAFSIIDDTDNATIGNVAPVYDFLTSIGIRATKTVWVYPPRNNYTGQCIQDADYLEFVKQLQASGHEIALHNVGSGSFTRQEIIRGLKTFRELIGDYPRIHINHASNPDNVYWGSHRFTGLLSPAYALFCRMRGRAYGGVQPGSESFWGDQVKRHIDYVRNLTFNRIDVLSVDPLMPYVRPGKEEFSNLWFSASDGHAIGDFNRLITKENVDGLERSGGACIVYTHFASGFLHENGVVNDLFVQRMEDLAQRDGWFAPVSQILDRLNAEGQPRRVTKEYEKRLQRRWLADRLIKAVRSGRRGSFKPD